MILVPCINCNADILVNITLEQFNHWRENRKTLPFVQHHFPWLSADEREALLTRFCPACFAKATL